MSNSAQYASTILLPNPAGICQLATGDASRTAPTLAHAPVLAVAGSNGARIDRIRAISTSSPSVASMWRIFRHPGWICPAITSITFSGTTATITFATNHGLTTGYLLTLWGVLPMDYNVVATAITVTGLNTLTYSMSTAPTINALSTTPGACVCSVAAPTLVLEAERSVTAITPSNTLNPWQDNISTFGAPTLMPLWLPPGWHLRASVNDTQNINVLPEGGQF